MACGLPVIISLRRWRDVKLRAFDYANHRTYVDLKVNFHLVDLGKVSFFAWGFFFLLQMPRNFLSHTIACQRFFFFWWLMVLAYSIIIAVFVVIYR